MKHTATVLTCSSCPVVLPPCFLCLGAMGKTCTTSVGLSPSSQGGGGSRGVPLPAVAPSSAPLSRRCAASVGPSVQEAGRALLTL